MLYKNGQLWDLNKDEKALAALAAEIGRDVKHLNSPPYNLIIKYTEQQYSQPTFNGAPVNKKPEYPAVVPIPLREVIHVAGEGAVEWAYTETVPQKDKSERNVYSPAVLFLERSMTIKSSKLDLMYFLLCISKCRKGSKYANKDSKPLFMVENKRKEAEGRVDVEKIRARAIVMITDKELGMTDDLLRNVALALRMDSAHEMSRPELEDTLVKYVNASPSNVEQFFEVSKADDVRKIRAVAQEAVGRKLIMGVNTMSAWFYKKEDGTRGEKICNYGPDRGPALEHHLKTTPADLEKFMDLIEKAKTAEVDVV